MDTNEIMANNEAVVELANVVEEADFGKVFKVAAGIGLVASLVGVVAYKYAIKPLVAKIKGKLKERKLDKEFDKFCEEAVIKDESYEIK